MANNFWKKLLGGAANAFVPGDIYNSYTGQWAPTGVRMGRIAAGVAGQAAGPAGTLAGMLANGAISRSEAGLRFDSGVQGHEGMNADFSNLPQWAQRGGDAPQMQTIASLINPGLGGMDQPGFRVGGNFTQFGGSQPVFDTGYADTQTSYGVSLPNYGPAGTPQAPAPSGGGSQAPTGAQAQMDINNQYRGAQDAFKSMRGDYASPNNFQSGSNSAIFGGGGRYQF